MVLLLVWWRPPCPQVIEVRDQTGNDDYQGCDEQKAGIVHAEKECSDYHTVPPLTVRTSKDWGRTAARHRKKNWALDGRSLVYCECTPDM